MSIRIPLTKNMNNHKPNFSTVIKTSIQSIPKHQRNTGPSINTTQTKAESHSSQTLLSPSFELPP